MPITIVIPFHAGDQVLVESLLEWIGELGGCPNNHCLLVAAEKGTDPERIWNLAVNHFRTVEVMKVPPLQNETHPIGPNWMFQRTALHFYRKKEGSFLWLEPDSVPMHKGWMEKIEEEYGDASRDILACVTKLNDPRFPKQIPSGVAVYPWSSWERYRALIGSKAVAWDIQFADEVISFVHSSKRIWSWPNHSKPVSYTDDDSAGDNVVPLSSLALCALVHPSKDGALIALLRKKAQGNRAVFYHSGDLGDVIYSLPTIRELGGGDLLLGPDNRSGMSTREKMTPARAALLIPLLESQSYIHSARYAEAMPLNVRFDLNNMRHCIRGDRLDVRDGYNLARCYLHTFKLDIKNDETWWLQVKPNRVAPVVFARSDRYNSKDFNWKATIAEYGKDAVFIGTPKEHDTFKNEFKHLPYYPTETLLEAAQVIAGADLFIGNQSAPYAIAEGLKKPAILETAAPSNVIFRRPSVRYSVAPRKPRLPKTPLIIRGPVDMFSGFGYLVRTIAVELTKRGRKVKLNPSMLPGTEFQPDIPSLPDEVRSLLIDPQTESHLIVSMHCGLPTLIQGGEVVFTMWESSRISPETKNALNQAKRVIVPSTWGATVMSACGVDAPLSIVPLGIDTDIYNPKPALNGVFTFGTAGRVAHGGCRKGINTVIAAFQKAFPINKKVRLKVKCFQDCVVDIPRPDTRITLNRQFLPDLANWYATLNCFVTATTSEGWGLHVHQAMACGKPVIAPEYSALTDFYDSSVGMPVPFDLVPATEYYEGKGVWAKVDETALANVMADTLKNTTLDRMGEKAAERAKTFSIGYMMDRLEAVLQKEGLL